jgi:heat shock protein HslJ
VRFRCHAAAALLCVCGLSACGTDNESTQRSATTPMPDLRHALAAHEWLLDGSGAQPVTLAFGADTVSGAAPCNGYHGGFSIKGDDTIAISMLASTKRACAPEVMRAEQKYLAALQGTHEVAVSGQQLVLSRSGGGRLAYTAIDPREQLLGTWQVVDVYRDNAIHSMILGTEPTLTFEKDGALVLDTGCNTVHGRYELKGRQITVEGLSQTDKACTEPPGVMEQEASLVQALKAASRIDVAPGTLKLLNEQGHIQLSAIR